MHKSAFFTARTRQSVPSGHLNQQRPNFFLHTITAFVLFLLLWTSCQTYHSGGQFEIELFPDLYEASIERLQGGMEAGHFTSVDLVKSYFARIDEVNIRGPSLRAILEINPSALTQAALLDRERRTSGKRGPLHGVPVLIKVRSWHQPKFPFPVPKTKYALGQHRYGMNTTAGSFGLLGSIVPDDAGVVKRLRAAGAIILGKASMSEWAQWRGKVGSGWSGRGGQCINAYYPNGDPSGSSSGSAVAVSIGLATVALGTETDGSITLPSSNGNIVGIKPTVGLTSRAGVIPLSLNQDTVGPMARSMIDAVLVLSAISGKDKNDNATLNQPNKLPDYTNALDKNALRGKRLGVPRRVFLDDSISGNDPFVNIQFQKALEVIQELGATVIDPADMPSAEEIVRSHNETIVFNVDFKAGLNQWFDSLIENPSGVHSLAELIKFNNDHPDIERPPHYEDQSTLIAAEKTEGFNAEYYTALAANRDLGSRRGIDAVLQENQLDALVLPAMGLARVPAGEASNMYGYGNNVSSYFNGISAIAGYPIVTVPLGFYPDDVKIGYPSPGLVYPAPGVPFGLSFLGTAFSEYDLIGFGYSYEQATRTRLERKAYDSAIPKTQIRDIVQQSRASLSLIKITSPVIYE
ncbi:hypothetical protein NP233_g3954 [Leucocoprinus birnbaumii]|uniref:Amidase domain-containing protein n=1 Tax=Leucocoprinus birnbaumii TaxID=56174 RepID=A0AAD5VWC2_9AGAR|nr:hypothetical protein NP233_g3954 [Leucocoprinus birnbaumii]